MPKVDVEHTDRRDGLVELEIDISESFPKRIRIVGSPEQIDETIKETVMPLIRDRERAKYRARFFAAAHVFVFGVAALSVIGMVAHFRNVWQFNITFLVSMGVWTVGAIIYLYLAIIKDIFGLKEEVPKPPRV